MDCRCLNKCMGAFHIGYALRLSAMQVPGRLLPKLVVTISESAREEIVLSIILCKYREHCSSWLPYIAIESLYDQSLLVPMRMCVSISLRPIMPTLPCASLRG